MGANAPWGNNYLCAIPGVRAVYGVGLHPLDCGVWGFRNLLRGWIFFCFIVSVVLVAEFAASWSLVQGHPAGYACLSNRAWSRKLKMRRPNSNLGYVTEEKNVCLCKRAAEFQRGQSVCSFIRIFPLRPLVLNNCPAKRWELQKSHAKTLWFPKTHIAATESCKPVKQKC